MDHIVEHHNEDSSLGAIIGVLVVIVLAVVAWLAYSQGWFAGRATPADNNGGSIEINLPDTTPGTNSGSGATPAPTQ